MTRRQFSGQQYPLPKAVGLDRLTATTLGGRVASILRLADPEQDPEAALLRLEDAVVALGGRVTRMGLADLSSLEARIGCIEIHDESSFDVFLPVDDEVGPISARETLAHELGHYFLHQPGSPDGTLRASHLTQDADAQAEKEATWFAEGLLVPDEALLRKMGETSEERKLAKAFSVSEQTILNRLRLLSVAAR